MSTPRISGRKSINDMDLKKISHNDVKRKLCVKAN